MLKAFLARRRIKKALKRFVPPEIARTITDGVFDASLTRLVEQDMEVVFVGNIAPDAGTCSEQLRAFAQLAEEHGGTVHTLLPVAVFAFGTISIPEPGSRQAFVAALHARFPDTPIVHGAIRAYVGSFGAEYQQFGFWWSGAPEAIRQLATLSRGHVHEFKHDETGV